MILLYQLHNIFASSTGNNSYLLLVVVFCIYVVLLLQAEVSKMHHI